MPLWSAWSGNRVNWRMASTCGRGRCFWNNSGQASCFADGFNLAKREPLARLLDVHGKLTADPVSGFWFPAVCLPPIGPTPPAKQWFQAGHGNAVDFRVKVELAK